MTATTAVRVGRLPRDLHPLAWWVWALGLATAASTTTNPFVLLLLVGVAALVVAARRSDQPWGRSFRLYLWLGLLIVVVRVLFRLVFGGSYGETVLLDLPGIPLPGWVRGITLLGPVTLESLLAGLYDGMRLAAIVICLGAANSLANPKRLLRSVPSALYEVGTALVVAVTVLPQLADSVRRVRAAQRLRAGDQRRVGRLRRTLVPVLEDALERSLALAAGMDTRGYGRTSGASPGARRTTGALLLLGLCGLCIGCYAVLDTTAPRYLALPMVVLGVLLAAAGLRSAGRRADRTTYRPDHWRWPETGVALSGLATGAACWWVGRESPLLAHPPLTEVPTVAGLALVGALAGLAAAVIAPPPRVVAA
ncbi:energy-coupling factor transporter transmembrane component T [Nocardioides sp. W7]|uniref:energy-coupling factor transporter transmembrane component T n=1 Tax=Nocardioides sp. W7 TaxID=2931390 RepID=UPI001FD014A6|nr:energy-coupling factor transporter transmembrane component T [Nocardioides sp. W7]